MKTSRKYGKVFLPKKAVADLYAEMPAFTVTLAPGTEKCVMPSQELNSLPTSTPL